MAFSGKVALITGASSGIGAGTAIHFASLGCKLSLCGRNKDNLNETAEKCIKAGLPSQDIKLIIGDLAKEEDAKIAVETTIEYFKRLDILVNSAGIIKNGTVETSSLADFDCIMNINVRSVYYLMQLSVPHLRKTKGNIVNVSSVTGLRSFPGAVTYCMSKSAIDQLTRCTALDLASDGIRVNAVNPGVIVTEIHKRGGMSEDAYAKFLERSRTTHALGRAGEVHEVAHAIAFLASDTSASFITGTTLSVDGGRGVMCPR